MATARRAGWLSAVRAGARRGEGTGRLRFLERCQHHGVIHEHRITESADESNPPAYPSSAKGHIVTVLSEEKPPDCARPPRRFRPISYGACRASRRGLRGIMWERCGKTVLGLPRSTSPRTQKAPQTRGQMPWAILGSNHTGGFRLGDVPRGCWAGVISGSLRFAQNGTLNGTSEFEKHIPRRRSSALVAYRGFRFRLATVHSLGILLSPREIPDPLDSAYARCAA